MPYIKQEERNYYDTHLKKMIKQGVMSSEESSMPVGHLNYIISKLLSMYISTNEESYSVYNGAIGVLECAKLEMYRRQVVPYEDLKIRENGDI